MREVPIQGSLAFRCHKGKVRDNSGCTLKWNCSVTNKEELTETECLGSAIGQGRKVREVSA